MLILEGCGVLSPALSECYDLRVWVDTAADESLARGMRRDIEEYGLDPKRVKEAWTEWSAWEAEALVRDDRRLRADLFV
jgi:uridine kinase